MVSERYSPVCTFFNRKINSYLYSQKLVWAMLLALPPMRGQGSAPVLHRPGIRYILLVTAYREALELGLLKASARNPCARRAGPQHPDIDCLSRCIGI